MRGAHSATVWLGAFALCFAALCLIVQRTLPTTLLEYREGRIVSANEVNVAADLGAAELVASRIQSNMVSLRSRPVSYSTETANVRRLEDLRALESSAALLGHEAKSAALAEERILVAETQHGDGGCADNHGETCGGESCCSFWASRGRCHAEENRDWMAVECARSCGGCSSSRQISRGRSSPDHEEAPLAVAAGTTAAAAAVPDFGDQGNNYSQTHTHMFISTHTHTCSYVRTHTCSYARTQKSGYLSKAASLSHLLPPPQHSLSAPSACCSAPFLPQPHVLRFPSNRRPPAVLSAARGVPIPPSTPISSSPPSVA